MTPNEYQFCCSDLFNHYQRSFLRQQMATNTHSQTFSRDRNLGTHCFKWDVSIKSYPRAQGALKKRRQRKSRKSQNRQRRTLHKNKNKQKTHKALSINWAKLTETRAASAGLCGSAPGPMRVYNDFQFSIFMGLLRVRQEALWFLYLLLGSFPAIGLLCLTSMWWFLFYLIIFYCYVLLLLLRKLLFSNERTEGE